MFADQSYSFHKLLSQTLRCCHISIPMLLKSMTTEHPSPLWSEMKIIMANA